MKRSAMLVAVFLCVSFSVMQAVCIPEGGNDKPAKTKVMENPSETWEFYSTLKEPTTEELATVGNYKFGKEVGYLYNIFMQTYVVKEEVVPGDPARRTVIRKPGIYNAVRSIEKRLSQDVKSQALTQGQAADEMGQVLRIALAAIDSDTDSFENALQASKKDTDRLLALFAHVQLKSLY